MKQFRDEEMMAAWLAAQGIHLSSWGTDPHSKTVHDLWTEIRTGEAALQYDPPMRVLQIVKIMIRNGSKALMEDYQDRENKKRDRAIFPTEKMVPGEDPVNAALRGIVEELLVKAEDAILIKVTRNQEDEIRESRSYPGLATKYTIFLAEFEIPSLPKTDFQTTEIPENPDKPIIVHHWKWVEAAAI